jgi:hypothetical protein
LARCPYRKTTLKRNRTAKTEILIKHAILKLSYPQCFIWQWSEKYIYLTKEIIFSADYDRNDTETVIASIKHLLSFSDSQNNENYIPLGKARQACKNFFARSFNINQSGGIIIIRIPLVFILLEALILSASSSASAKVIDGRINDVIWPSEKVYDRFESIPFYINLTNTGTETHSFWVGYSVQDANGRLWNDPDIAQQTAYIEPGGSASMGLSWNPRNDASRGSFIASVILWEGWKNDFPRGELDRKTKSEAFQLNSSSGFKNDVKKINANGCC